MATDQKVEQAWETPSHDEIPNITKMHVQYLEQTDDDAVWIQAGMHHVMIRTVGRKSGNVHKIAVPFWRDPDDVRVVVASFAGAEVVLTATELAILARLMRRPEIVLSRNQIMDAAYGPSIHVSDRTIDSHVRNIRAKLAAVGCEASIATVHGVGFKLGPCQPARLA